MQTTICQEKRLGDNPRITILNTEIDVLNVNETIALVEKYVQTKTPLHLMGVNADKINEVNQNAKMREIVNSCGVINADGAWTIEENFVEIDFGAIKNFWDTVKPELAQEESDSVYRRSHGLYPLCKTKGGQAAG